MHHWQGRAVGTANIDTPNDRASFVVSEINPIITAGTYNLVGAVPNSAVTNTIHVNSNADAKVLTLALPHEQSIQANTFDPKADILVSEPITFNVSAGDITAGHKSIEAMFSYYRPFAMAKFTLTNAPAEVANDEVIDVVLHTSAYNLAGKARINVDTKEFLNGDLAEIEGGDLTAKPDQRRPFYIGQQFKSITLTPAISTKVSDLVLWFTSAPIAGTEGTFTITINTPAHTIVRTIDLTAKHLQLDKDKLKTANISLANATVTNTIVTTTTEDLVEWELVENASTLSANDKIIICTADNLDSSFGADYAMSTLQNTSSRGFAAITKSDDKKLLYFNENAAFLPQEIVLARTSDNHWALQAGSSYLHCSSTRRSSSLNMTSTLDNTSKWDITISNGVATIKAVQQFFTQYYGTISFQITRTNTGTIWSPSYFYSAQYNCYSAHQSSTLSSFSYNGATAIYRKKVTPGDTTTEDNHVVPYFSIAQLAYTTGHEQGEVFINYTAVHTLVGAVIATADQSWLTYTSDGEFEVTHNSGTTSRTATVQLINTTTGEVLATITITQLAEGQEHSIVGQWCCEIYDEDNTTIHIKEYVEFKADNTFDLYQNLNGEVGSYDADAYVHYTGTYYFNGGQISGVYSDDTPWTYSYSVAFNSAATEVTLTSSQGSNLYVKGTIPASVISSATEGVASTLSTRTTAKKIKRLL